MIESNVKSLILLTTGRRLDLVIWEMKNQIQYAGLDLLSLKSIMTESLCYVNSADSLNNYEPSSTSIKESSTSKLNEVLFKAVFFCLPTDGDVLKEALGNCVLLRSVYEEEVASAFGTAQLWRILTDEGLSSSISSEILTLLPRAFNYRVCYAQLFLMLLFPVYIHSREYHTNPRCCHLSVNEAVCFLLIFQSAV